MCLCTPNAWMIVLNGIAWNDKYSFLFRQCELSSTQMTIVDFLFLTAREDSFVQLKVHSSLTYAWIINAYASFFLWCHVSCQPVSQPAATEIEERINSLIYNLFVNLWVARCMDRVYNEIQCIRDVFRRNPIRNVPYICGSVQRECTVIRKCDYGLIDAADVNWFVVRFTHFFFVRSLFGSGLSIFSHWTLEHYFEESHDNSAASKC